MKTETSKYSGIYFLHKKNNKYILTKNLTPGKTFFSEKTIGSYRVFNPLHSKLAAAIMQDIKDTYIKKNDKILYLGAAHGYTISFISDIIQEKGLIYAVEFAPSVAKELIFLSEQRSNILPILADANQPEKYKNRISKEVNVLYQDISQKNQAEILLKNLIFLKNGGYVLFSAKARSIDTTKEPSKVFKEIVLAISRELEILESVRLEPFERDHCLFICKKVAKPLKK